MEAALRALRPIRLRHRLRRVLQRDLFRRGPAAARRARRGEDPRPRGLCAPDRAGVTVEALERSGIALRFRCRRCEDPRTLRALSHLPRRSDEQCGAARLDRRVDGRGARRREPPPLPREVRGVLRTRSPRPAARDARCRVLFLGGPCGLPLQSPSRGRRHRVRARALRGDPRDRASGQLHLARGARRESRPRLRAHGARLDGAGRDRGRASHPRLPRASRGRRTAGTQGRLMDSANALQAVIDGAFERRAEISAASATAEVKAAVAKVLARLDAGSLRVSEKQGGEWVTHQWVKKAVLLSFRLRDNEIMQGGYTHYFDKVDSKFARYSQEDFAAGGYRVVPPATVRHGAFIAKNVILMPSFVNIGAYVDEGTMVDTWATVGSCAQIGKNVHLSGGVGIGAVLDPLPANPTVISDNCFIG